MRLILVCNEDIKVETIQKIELNGLACNKNILYFSDIERAKEFIVQDVIDQPGTKKHIDLVVVDDVTDGSKYEKNLCEWIRSHDGFYSDNNFRISSIPVILYKKEGSLGYGNTIYDDVVPFAEYITDNRLITASKKVVKNWREKILADLDVLSIRLEDLNSDYGSNKLPYSNYSIIKNYDLFYTRTSVFSTQFIKKPKRLNYEWLEKGFLIKILQSHEEYNKIITGQKKYYGKTYERKVLQEFYNNNPHFLKRDIYENQQYSKYYHISSTSAFHIPDYVLTSPFPEYIATSISEIKRDDKLLEYNPKRHEPFTRYFKNSLMQQSNYEDDFLKPQNQDLITQKIGYQTNNFQFDLIIGLESTLTDHLRLKVNKHFSSINIITHDKLLQLVEHYYIREEGLNIF